MLALFGGVLAIVLLCGVLRRGGLALWLALLVGAIVFGGEVTDPAGAALAAGFVFVAVRFAQS